jgi:uncharacterized protein (TIGR02996 family)
MPTEEDLLSVIDANIDDDAPRLAHADWLEANGNRERAEFIRAQLEGEEVDTSVYTEGLPRVPGMQWACRRGYPEQVTFGSVTAFKKGWPLTEGRRVRHVVFECLKGGKGLAALPGLSAIEGLGLDRLSNDDVRDVLASPHLTRLRRLSLRLWLDSAFLPRLAAVPALAQLHTLEIDGPYIITVEERDFAALVTSPHLAGLRVLRIENCALGPGLRHLWRSPQMAGLTTLELQLSDYWHGERRLHGLEQLGDGGRMPALERFAFTGITNAGEIGAVVARATKWGRLRSLCLNDTRTDDEGARALAAAAHLSHLERLDLGRCKVSDGGAAALASSSHLGSLRSLNLSENVIGAVGVAALGRCTKLPHLRRLRLASNPAPPPLIASVEARFREGGPPVDEAPPAPPPVAVAAPSAPLIGEADEDGLIRAIWADPYDDVARAVYADWLEEQGKPHHAGRLRATTDKEREKAMRQITASAMKEAPCSLTLAATDEGLIRVQVSVRSLRTKGFERDGPVWMQRHHVAEVALEGTPRVWAALFAAPWLAHTRGLTFAGRKFDAYRTLAASPQVEGLASLVLGEGPYVVDTALFTETRMRGLCRLLLLFNSGFIRAETMQALVAAPFAPGLRNLALKGVGGEGQLESMALLGSPALAGLVTLSLADCRLDDVAIKALADTPGLPALRNLDLRYNWFRHAGLDALAGSPLLARLRRLCISRRAFSDADLERLTRAVKATPHCQLILE